MKKIKLSLPALDSALFGWGWRLRRRARENLGGMMILFG
jgi:hypothetical protein